MIVISLQVSTISLLDLLFDQPSQCRPCDAFVRQIPPQLFDNTFRRTLLHDREASWMLQVLHLNIYGCLYFPPIEERKKIAMKAASSSASSSKGKGKGKK
ncbi:hypothetical protein MTR67_032356 [Solanum verrucosum]|uniref:Uncharacterized protein n=1 Tax=Solanum verrucosum TaxID=315347 RepID=A0AAF0ZFH4_SOLVR|nr:hypothetical protein MTR67_032356 [Solanum verrucosum]